MDSWTEGFDSTISKSILNIKQILKISVDKFVNATTIFYWLCHYNTYIPEFIWAYSSTSVLSVWPQNMCNMNRI
jgi:hypothetical protein